MAYSTEYQGLPTAIQGWGHSHRPRTFTELIPSFRVQPPTLALAREDREDVSLHPSLSPYLKVSISIYQKLTYAWAVSEVSILSHYFLLVFWFWLWNPVLFGWFRSFVCFVSVPQVQEVRLVVFPNSWHPVLLGSLSKTFLLFYCFSSCILFPHTNSSTLQRQPKSCVCNLLQSPKMAAVKFSPHCPCRSHHPSRGRVHFPSPWIWAARVTCLDQ